MAFSPLSTPEVVIFTTFFAAIDENVVKISKFSFHWYADIGDLFL